jgi:exonuclease SbcD
MRVFLAPGNHDSLTATSVYAQMMPLPENVHVFPTRSFSPAPLADGITLWGFAHQHPADREPAMSGFRCEGPGLHLMLFHGSDRDRMPPGKESVAPFTTSQIEAAGAAHAMVGHFHDMLAGGRHAYPGSPEPHNFSQTGRHTASIVTVEDGRVSTEFVDINRTRYCELDFDVTPYGDRAAVAEALAARLESLASTPELVFWRVRLVGELQRTLEFDAAELQEDLGDRFGVLTLVEDYSAFDYDAILRGERRTVRSEFVREMRKRIDDAASGDRAVLERALSYGMLAFAGKRLPE